MSEVEHRIYLPGQIGKALFNSRLHRDDHLRKGRGLMAYPQPSPEEVHHILGVASLLNQLHSPVILQHPKLPLLLSATRECSARQVYLFTAGDHNQPYLDLLKKAVQPGDTVLELGAGLGLGSILAMRLGAKKAIAVEPNPVMQHAINRNAEINKVDIEVRHGCVVPGQVQGETTFHIVEEAWASNIFDHLVEERIESLTVPVINAAKLVEQYQPQVLALDIQGAELGLFTTLSLENVRDIILASHTPLTGEKATAETLATLHRLGFELKEMSGWVFHFSK